MGIFDDLFSLDEKPTKETSGSWLEPPWAVDRPEPKPSTSGSWLEPTWATDRPEVSGPRYELRKVDGKDHVFEMDFAYERDLGPLQNSALRTTRYIPAGMVTPEIEISSQTYLVEGGMAQRYAHCATINGVGGVFVQGPNDSSMVFKPTASQSSSTESNTSAESHQSAPSYPAQQFDPEAEQRRSRNWAEELASCADFFGRHGWAKTSMTLYAWASNHMELARDLQKSAEYAEKSGNFADAMHKYARSGKPSDAMRVAQQTGQTKDAQELLMMHGEYYFLGERYLAVGEHRKAAEMFYREFFKQTEDYDQRYFSLYESAELYAHTGQLEKARNCAKLLLNHAERLNKTNASWREIDAARGYASRLSGLKKKLKI